MALNGEPDEDDDEPREHEIGELQDPTIWIVNDLKDKFRKKK
jgi:hypothetical protein